MCIRRIGTTVRTARTGCAIFKKKSYSKKYFSVAQKSAFQSIKKFFSVTTKLLYNTLLLYLSVSSKILRQIPIIIYVLQWWRGIKLTVKKQWLPKLQIITSRWDIVQPWGLYDSTHVCNCLFMLACKCFLSLWLSNPLIKWLYFRAY